MLTSASHRTPLGTLWSRWSTIGLYGLSWDRPAPTPPSRSLHLGQLDQLLCEYFANGHADFHRVEIDESGWTDFSRRIYRACRQIGSGETISYKELARLAGRERASRAVGTAMAKNRITIVIPCHRVVASGGKLGGYSGPGGIQLKRKLIELEQNRVSDTFSIGLDADEH